MSTETTVEINGIPADKVDAVAAAAMNAWYKPRSDVNNALSTGAFVGGSVATWKALPDDMGGLLKTVLALTGGSVASAAVNAAFDYFKTEK